MPGATAKLVAPIETTEKHGDFSPITGTTGTTIYILDEMATQPDSMRKLSDANLEAFTRQEILLLLMKDKTLKSALKGKLFWLKGEGLEEDGIFTVDNKGELREAGKKRLSIEQKVRARGGNQPLLFSVYFDHYAHHYGRRFNLYANVDLQYGGATGVVGKPIDREAAAQKNILRTTKKGGTHKIQAGRKEFLRVEVPSNTKILLEE